MNPRRLDLNNNLPGSRVAEYSTVRQVKADLETAPLVARHSLSPRLGIARSAERKFGCDKGHRVSCVPSRR